MKAKNSESQATCDPSELDSGSPASGIPHSLCGGCWICFGSLVGSSSSCAASLLPCQQLPGFSGFESSARSTLLGLAKKPLNEQDFPRAVVVDRVPADDVVVVAREHHAAPNGPGSGDARGRDVGVVVVVHGVFREQPAVVRARRTRFACVRTRAVLWRGCVVVVLAVADESRLVVVELRVLDRQVPARVRARVPERAAFRMGVVKDRVAVATRADVVVGVGHVVGVRLGV